MRPTTLPFPTAAALRHGPKLIVVLLAFACICLEPLGPASAYAASATGSAEAGALTTSASSGAGSLETAASKAGDTARKVAMSLIGLALAVAGIVLLFRRDFGEAAGVFAIGLLAVLLATSDGLSLLQNTVSSLFG